MSKARMAFTLVEMVIVIGIVILLAALTLAVSVVVVEGSEIRQTEATIKLLDAAVNEWEAQSDRQVTWGMNNQPFPNMVYEMQDGTPHAFLISELINVMGRSSQIKDILAKIDPDFVHRYDSSNPPPPWIRNIPPGDPDPNSANTLSYYNSGDWDGSLAILDAWGTPLRVVHPGRLWDPTVFATDAGEQPDPDGTIRLTLTYGGGTYGTEQCYGVAANRRLCFVSAGPDGRFGDFSAATDSQAFAFTKDNVYSYALTRVSTP